MGKKIVGASIVLHNFYVGEKEGTVEVILDAFFDKTKDNAPDMLILDFGDSPIDAVEFLRKIADAIEGIFLKRVEGKGGEKEETVSELGQ